MPVYKNGTEIKTGSITVAYLMYDRTADVGIGQADNFLLQPPAGYIYKVRDMYISMGAVATSTTGQHGVYIYYDSGDAWCVNISEMESNFNESIRYRCSFIEYCSVGKLPADLTMQGLMVKDLIASNTYPITVSYSNNTDAIQTSDRYFRFIVEKVKV